MHMAKNWVITKRIKREIGKVIYGINVQHRKL
jgi:hypothetical protein